jgi:hypothetical protein
MGPAAPLKAFKPHAAPLSVNHGTEAGKVGFFANLAPVKGLILALIDPCGTDIVIGSI